MNSTIQELGSHYNSKVAKPKVICVKRNGRLLKKTRKKKQSLIKECSYPCEYNLLHLI